jgi:hypothetical protein
VHAAAAAPSTEQVVPVTEVVASVAVKFNATGEPTVEPLVGAVIVTTGLTESIVKLRVALPEPAALVAVTVTVWLP